ncbi:hypothetical protein EON65_58160 [archaeon]|nr:MAG: hypothetical protein EON65_58160 [archaeon]
MMLLYYLEAASALKLSVSTFSDELKRPWGVAACTREQRDLAAKAAFHAKILFFPTGSRVTQQGSDERASKGNEMNALRGVYIIIDRKRSKKTIARNLMNGAS